LTLPASLQSIVVDLRQRGLVTREVVDLAALLELSIARGEFVVALLKTPDWSELVAGSRPWATPGWLQQRGIDASWTRDWLARVDASQQVLLPEPNFDVIVLRCQNRLVLFGWQGDEQPPDPIGETETEFLDRMARAWDRRARLLGGHLPDIRRDITKHADWFVRSRVQGESAAEIQAGHSSPLDLSTITQAVKRFGEIVELP
jgi:hypothetical protein